MAQSTGSDKSAQQAVDIEDIEVDILILAKNPNSLKNANAFLNKRGWPTYVVGPLSKFIEHVADHRPDIVLISLNHPNPAVIRLPELITQTFNIPCVGFVEGTDAASVQKLSSFKMRYKVFGQPSGPNIQRGIRRILAERFNLKLDDASKYGEKKEGVLAHADVNPNGAKSAKVVKGSATAKPVVKLFGSDSTPVKAAHKRKRLKDIAPVADKGAGANFLYGENLDPNAPPKPAPPPPKDVAGFLKKSLFGESGDKHDKEYEAQAIAEQVQLETLEKSVTNAVKKLFQAKSVDAPPIHEVSRIGVFPVDSQSAPGYIVVAFGDDRSQQATAFLTNCEGELQESLSTAGFNGKVESGFWLEIPNVDFASWVSGMGAFNLTVESQGLAVGVAFFQSPRPLTKAQASHDNSMYTVPIEEISTEYPVNFKAYIHFNRNHKFYLYLRNGRQLQPEQKERLLDHKVNELFMKSVDLENLRMFLAAVYLRDSIKGSGEAA